MFPHVWKSMWLWSWSLRWIGKKRWLSFWRWWFSLCWTDWQDLIHSHYDCDTVAERKGYSCWSDTIRNRDFIMKVQEMVNNDPSKSTWRPTLRSWRLWCCPRPRRNWGIRKISISRILLPATPLQRARSSWASSFLPSQNLMFSLQTHPTSIVWIFLYGAQLRETPTELPVTPKDLIITFIQASFTNLPRDAVNRACQRFRGRIEAVIKAKSNFIE